jgi:enoyl reductase
MPGRLNRARIRAVLTAVVSLAVIWVVAPPAVAGDGSPPPKTTKTPEDHNGELSSRVTVSGTGTATGADTQPIESSDVNFTPPDCWYESFTPDEFEAVLDARYNKAGNDNAGTVYNYLWQVRSDMSAKDYNRGKDGSWWLLVYNPKLPPDTGGNCTLTGDWMWVGPGDPPAPAVVTPEMLSKVAYGATNLIKGKVALSPAADNQKVNLPTYVTFQAALPEVWVTAQVPNPPVAATVVADPVALHVTAGSSDASPQTCDYKFVQNGDSFNVDSSGAGCNITYRRATPKNGTFTLVAQITWKVHWTASADRNGPAAAPPLADGYTTTRQPVEVQEIQAVNR